ncbi:MULTISPECIES: F0F1 ATP synthase subunit A [Azospirillaceae]|uniref:F0F1 ATP synthase subunit A n=1 Tax=Azospirillaceae TaxID=2829815 RepID=UPI000B689DAB|nr:MULTISPECIES: F0F1 ATP synthase subunit A [Azospirillaceae]MDG5494277.1 F0F1 ATP synthase subunit A [Niveispirillum sp. BGYR6]SNR95632.1 ATP synthase F0 subcomplex A subunit [Azospirillum sp. RU38E]SNS12151.1 ATP synthase F0 subcomplex A subunit [Azospirillum sp. RU37A]
MNLASPFAADVAFHLGPLAISWPVIFGALVSFILALTARLLAGRVGRDQPGRIGTALEAVVTILRDQFDEIMQTDSRPFLPLLGSLFLFIAASNWLGLIPGFKSPTAHLETTLALGLTVFGAAQVLGVRVRGLRAYLAGFAHPRWWMLPLNLLSEFTRTLSLVLRLFGNVMSGEFVIAIVLSLAGFLVPVPLMALEALLGLIQAYIFTILAAVFIGGAIGTIERG